MKIVFSDVNVLLSLKNTFIPLLHKSYSVHQNNSSGMKCSDEFDEHAQSKIKLTQCLITIRIRTTCV